MVDVFQSRSVNDKDYTTLTNAWNQRKKRLAEQETKPPVLKPITETV